MDDTHFAKAGLPADTMATVRPFDGYADAENDPEFGQTKFSGRVEEDPYAW